MQPDRAKEDEAMACVSTGEAHRDERGERLCVHLWRVERLRQLGIPPGHAELVADQVDWHAIRDLVARGCAPALALRIVR
jgi:hypothetical protein